jgi:hypothetical protein
MTEHLSAADMEILAFERTPFRGKSGRKDAAILDRFGDMPTRYYQRLHAVAAKPAALAYDPELVNRLNRLRDARAAQRSARRRETQA